MTSASYCNQRIIAEASSIPRWLYGGFVGIISSEIVVSATGPVWLQEMTAMATARHETINSRMKVWAILRNAYKYGKGTDERMHRHGRTVKAIANVVNIWLTESPSFPCEYDDSDCM
jgi:hypothetical protein